MIHIHNGDVAASLARRSGIPGEHLPFREALIGGPVAREPQLDARAVFLSDSSGENRLRLMNDLAVQDRALTAALEHDEIVLWFEHDLYCLVHFLYLLQRFAGARQLTHVWCPQALGEKDEAEMHLLYDSRGAVPPAMLSIAAEAWFAYTSSEPTALNAFLSPRAEFPFLAEGLALHASRFPSRRNGLGSYENRILTLIAAGATDFATLFSRFDADPPRYGFGDGEMLRVLRAMANAPVPLITLTESEGTPPNALFTLTPAAENVMSGAVDYIAVSDPDFWLGGVHVTRENVWRWDDERRQILPNLSAVS